MSEQDEGEHLVQPNREECLTCCQCPWFHTIVTEKRKSEKSLIQKVWNEEKKRVNDKKKCSP